MRAHLAAEKGERMGHDRAGMTWDVARTCVRGYAVRDPHVVLAAMREIYNVKCVPPYSDDALAERVGKAYDNAHSPEWGAEYKQSSEKIREGYEALGGAPPTQDEVPPTNAALIAALEAASAKLCRRTNAGDKLDGELIKRVLKNECFRDERELAQAVAAVVKHAPAGTTDDQLFGVLDHCGNPNLIRDLIRAVRARAAAAASPDVDVDQAEFEIDSETGRPYGNQRNIHLALAKLGVTMRWDEFARRKVIEQENKREIAQDHHITALRLQIDREFGFLPGKDFFWDVLDDRAHANTYHPVRDYLDGLKWDSVKRLDTWLIDCAGAEDTPYTRAVSRLPLVAAVRRVRHPGAKYDEMLTLESPVQGTEKSGALRALCPEPRWFTDNIPLDAKPKELMEQTVGKWIVEVQELKGRQRAGREHVKALLSGQDDNARMAYGREPEYRERQFIIFGTSNEVDYLDDRTGNRRFWPVRIGRFDMQRLLRDRDQLWAEAAAAEAAGESIRLSKDLWPAAAAEQAKRQRANRFEPPILDVLDERYGKIRVPDVWCICGFKDRVPTDAEQTEIGEAMKNLGWSHDRLRFGKAGKKGCYVRGDEAQRKQEIRITWQVTEPVVRSSPTPEPTDAPTPEPTDAQ